jgi:hypothetical protein
MADAKISQMPPDSSLAGTELVPVVSAGINYNATTAAIAALCLATPFNSDETDYPAGGLGEALANYITYGGGSDAGSISYDPTAIYEGGTVGAAISLLQQDDQVIQQASPQQVIVTQGSGVITLSLPQSIGTTSNVQFQDTTVRRLKSSNSVTINSVGPGAGSGGSLTYALGSGDELAFVFNITTGNSPSAGSTLVTFQFTAAFTNLPIIWVSAYNSPRTAAVQASATSSVYMNTSTQTTAAFQISTNTSALAANTAYSFLIQIHGT